MPFSGTSSRRYSAVTFLAAKASALFPATSLVLNALVRLLHWQLHMAPEKMGALKAGAAILETLALKAGAAAVEALGLEASAAALEALVLEASAACLEAGSSCNFYSDLLLPCKAGWMAPACAA